MSDPPARGGGGAQFPPPGYRRRHLGGREVVALESAAEAVAEILATHRSLGAWAARHAEKEVGGGRGPVWRVDLGGITAAVRHYRRGGWMGPLLGDRYFDSPPRPFAELTVSEALRAAGVRTPRVLAAVVARAGPGYRADLATEWLSPGLDLESLLRPNVYPPAERGPAVEAAGRAIGRSHAAGLDHPDLRPRNVFLALRAEGIWEAAILDLDRARIAAVGSRRRDPAKKKTSPASGDLSRRSVARAA